MVLRRPGGGSFVRPAKVGLGVDFLAAVARVYQIDAEEVTSSDISFGPKKVKWGKITERRYDLLAVLSRGEGGRGALK